MIQIDRAVFSPDIFEKQFACDLSKCKGMCCVYGDSGAPLDDDEVDVLERIYPKVKPYMTPAGIEAVEKQGLFVTDFDDDKVTPLIGDSEDCAFTRTDDGIVYCAIEKAFLNGETDFRKPLSCHLYPIRITKYTDFEAVNYHCWDICCDALRAGQKTGTPLYVFLKEPLIRKFGAGMYEELCIAAGYLKKS